MTADKIDPDYNDLRLRAQSRPWNAGVSFILWLKSPSGKSSYASPIEMVEVEPGQAGRESFSLNRDAAQTLMDDLWNTGIRPTEGAGSAGSLRATEKHLEDMRRLVFKPEEAK